METYKISLRKIFGSVVTLAVLALLVFAVWSAAVKPVGSGLYIRFLSVGQGDAELIQTPSHQNILIDGGPDDTVLSQLDQFMPFYGRSIDAVILTHPHADHVVGLTSVLKKYQVKAAYITGVVYTTPEYLSFLNELKDRKIPTKDVKMGDSLDLGGGVKINILYPLQSLAGQTAGDMNNTSIVARLTYGDSAVLFTGDVEKDGQQEIVDAKEDIKSDILKVAHHGSRNATNVAFDALVKPKYAVIEVGKDNTYKLPNAESFAALAGTQMFRTDQDGTISFEIGKNGVRQVK